MYDVLFNELLVKDEYAKNGIHVVPEYTYWNGDKKKYADLRERSVESLPNEIDVKYLSAEIATGTYIIRTVSIIRKKTGEYLFKVEEIKGPEKTKK